MHTRGIEHVWRDYVQLAVEADGIADYSGSASIRACLGSKGVKNRAYVEYLAGGGIGTWRKSIACYPIAKIACAFCGIRHSGDITQGITYAASLVAAKDEFLVHDSPTT